MSDVNLVAIWVAQVCPVVAYTVVDALAGRALVFSARFEAREVSFAHSFWIRRQEGDHAAVACRRRLAIERHVDVKAREFGVRRDPARRFRSTVWHYLATTQADREEDRVVERRSSRKIVGSNGDMAEHSAL